MVESSASSSWQMVSVVKGGLNFVANDKHSHSQHKLKATAEKDMNQDTEK